MTDPSLLIVFSSIVECPGEPQPQRTQVFASARRGAEKLLKSRREMSVRREDRAGLTLVYCRALRERQARLPGGLE